MSRIVVALGGNALGNSPEEQQEKIKKAVKGIIALIKDGHEIVITHGNGPQVGIINLAFEDSYENESIPRMPLAECTAMSQGYIGYHLQKEIQEALEKENIDKRVVSIITQVLVDYKDDAFKNPTKPIGPFYTKREAKHLMKGSKDVYKEDAGRGYRKVVASPKPIDIIEKETIEYLSKHNHVVIACGGGGIPVIEKRGLHGVSAVIDKDLSSSKLADLIDADYLIILTAVDKVELNYNKPNSMKLDKMTVDETEEYINQNQFSKGSMLPKIEASINFVNNHSNRKAIIANLNDCDNIFDNNIGTIITNK
jgi:carbamate kinase